MRTAVASDDDDTPGRGAGTLFTVTADAGGMTGGMGGYVLSSVHNSYTWPPPLPPDVQFPDAARLESDVRRTIAERLVKYIRTCSKVGYPEVFVQGMERALEVVTATSLPSASYVQDPLF